MPKRNYAAHADAKRAYDVFLNCLQALERGKKRPRMAANNINCAAERVIVFASTFHAIKSGPPPILVKYNGTYRLAMSSEVIHTALTGAERRNYLNYYRSVYRQMES